MGEQQPFVANELPGNSSMAVQAGFIHGGVHVHPASQSEVLPQELPPDVFGFTGRTSEIAELDSLVAARSESTAVIISAVSGTAGVGKTALVVHWAHRVLKEFPDGQLYIDLRGYGPGQPLTPTKALAGFLRSLGVEAQKIPHELSQRSALYRSLVAGRRMLVVLDNARTAEQVRYLLPGSSTCFVIVTSRDSLSGLVSRDGARRIDLDLLPLSEAVSLLGKLVGDRVQAEPTATQTLADRCARLPLALRIAAELATARHTEKLEDLVTELADEQDRLAVFDSVGDPRTAVRGVFSWSYSNLTAETAHLFRMLGLHIGQHYDVYSVATLADIEVIAAKRLVSDLVQAHLLIPCAPGIFKMHDLLRVYAKGLAMETISAESRAEKVSRLLDHYLDTAYLATAMVTPHDPYRIARKSKSTSRLPTIVDYAEAAGWLERARSNLLLSAAFAAASDFRYFVCDLSIILRSYLYTRAYYDDAIALHNAALEVGKTAGNRSMQAHALDSLGIVYRRLGRYSESVKYHESALDLSHQVADRPTEGSALRNLAAAYEQLGRYGDALHHLQAALGVATDTDDQVARRRVLNNLGDIYERLGQYEDARQSLKQALISSDGVTERSTYGRTLNNLGDVYERLGNYGDALQYIKEALVIFSEIDDRAGRGYAFNSLAVVYAKLQDCKEAIVHHRHALLLARETGERSLEMETLNALGDTLRFSGDPSQARECYVKALSIALEVGNLYQEARSREGLGYQADSHGNWNKAVELYERLGVPEAQALRERFTALKDTTKNA
jgi:tetratricopeptide (TPR) repeat protein